MANPATTTTTAAAAAAAAAAAEQSDDRNRSESELARRQSAAVVVDENGGILDSSAADKGEGGPAGVAASGAGELLELKKPKGFKNRVASFFQRRRGRGPAVGAQAPAANGARRFSNALRSLTAGLRRGPCGQQLESGENSTGPATIRMDSSSPAVGSGGGPTLGGAATALPQEAGPDGGIASDGAATANEEAPRNRRFSLPRLPSWRKGAKGKEEEN